MNSNRQAQVDKNLEGMRERQLARELHKAEVKRRWIERKNIAGLVATSTGSESSDKPKEKFRLTREDIWMNRGSRI